MKQGRNIVELAEELQRRSEMKQDFLTPTTKIQLVEASYDQGIDHMLRMGESNYEITPHTHRQMGTWAGVPAKYYDRMKEQAPHLLTENMNHWFGQSEAKRMVRTLDGTARAFLSDRYRRIDNEDVAEQVLPLLMDGAETRIVSCDVTDTRLYIKALFPKVEGQITVGDEVQAGVVISNSEIGMGSLSIMPLIYRLVCSNGMISQDHGLSRYHVGRKIIGDGDSAFELFRQDTLQADDQALMMKVRDIVKAASQRNVFDAIVAKMQEARLGEKIAKPVDAVELMAKSFNLNEHEKGSVLENLIRGQDYSKFGAMNAVTATANNHESYDRATELEALGGKVLDLSPKDWTVIAEAA